MRMPVSPDEVGRMPVFFFGKKMDELAVQHRAAVSAQDGGHVAAPSSSPSPLCERPRWTPEE
eukprot:1505813-Prorocentrum_lima.AAC.1